MPTQPYILLEDAAVTGPGVTVGNLPSIKSIDAIVTGPAPASAVVQIEVCNANGAWKPLGVITLTATAPSDGAVFDAPWTQTRANVTALSAGAKVTCVAGVSV